MAERLLDFAAQLSAQEAGELEVRAGKFFQPRTPITTRELFSGRWPEITKLADVITQPGLHATNPRTRRLSGISRQAAVM